MEYYDKDGNKLHLNDYVEIVTVVLGRKPTVLIVG